MYRPTSLAEQLLIPKLQGQPNVPEEWKNGGGGFGGPIMRNRTFFWAAGEKYVNNQPQQNSFLVPTSAERRGDFSGLTRNGAPVTIRDPLTGQPFPGNIIPANRISPVGQKLINYFPTPTTDVDNGSTNFSMTDLLPNSAYQFTTKANHNFSDAISMSALRAAPGDARGQLELQPREQVRRRELPARSHHQHLRASTTLTSSTARRC